MKFLLFTHFKQTKMEHISYSSIFYLIDGLINKCGKIQRTSNILMNYGCIQYKIEINSFSRRMTQSKVCFGKFLLAIWRGMVYMGGGGEK